MTDSVASNDSALEPICAQIQQVLLSPYSVVLHCHLALLGTVLTLIFVLVRQFYKHPIVVHPNLLLLFVNIILLYFLNAFAWFVVLLRYRILLFFYQNPCQLVTPFWMAATLIAPYQIYSVAFPMFHFALMFERFRATFRVERYETENHRLTVGIVALIWLLSLLYMAFVVVSALADSTVSSRPQGILALTSKYNNNPLIYAMICTLCIILTTAFCDWRIYKINERIRAQRNLYNYSLSRNYQLNENALAMRLILPLDISYALLYPVYICIVLVLRIYKPMMSLSDFYVYYSTANTLIYLHSFITLIVYIRFAKFVGKSQRRNVAEVEPAVAMDLQKMHFKQLRAQWG